MENDIKNTNIIKQVLTSEVKFIIAIITIVLGVVAPYYQIKQDVALIKENHFTHIENMQREILELKEEDTRLQEQYVDLLKVMNDK
jgi:hypothetical protein